MSKIGIPRNIQSDTGGEFQQESLYEILRRMGIEWKKSFKNSR